MIEIMLIVHIAKSTEIYALTDQTLPSHASDAVLFAGIAEDVVMTDTDRRVVYHSQVISLLVTDSVISSRSGVPLNHNCLIGSRVRARTADLDHCPAVTFAVVYRVVKALYQWIYEDKEETNPEETTSSPVPEPHVGLL